MRLAVSYDDGQNRRSLLMSANEIEINLMTQIDFIKMSGLGNDFIVIDLRQDLRQDEDIRAALTEENVRHLAARDNPTTYGCDQLLTIEPPKQGGDVYMGIYNADGSQAEACGNGTRAVATYLGLTHSVIETCAGELACVLEPSGTISVNMGLPRFEPSAIPVRDTLSNLSAVPLHADLPEAFIVGMGNPHAVLFVDNPRAMAERYGAALEHHDFFPKRANINFARVEETAHLTLVTWERGAGLTPACGSGACATAVAYDRLYGGTKGAAIRIDAPGGTLNIRVTSDGVWMNGPAVTEFTATAHL